MAKLSILEVRKDFPLPSEVVSTFSFQEIASSPAFGRARTPCAPENKELRTAVSVRPPYLDGQRRGVIRESDRERRGRPTHST